MRSPEHLWRHTRRLHLLLCAWVYWWARILCESKWLFIHCCDVSTCRPPFLPFLGNNCEIEVNECLSQPCQNGGSCIDELDSFSCRCPLGITGISNTFHPYCVTQAGSIWLGKHCNCCNDCNMVWWMRPSPSLSVGPYKTVDYLLFNAADPGSLCEWRIFPPQFKGNDFIHVLQVPLLSVTLRSTCREQQ